MPNNYIGSGKRTLWRKSENALHTNDTLDYNKKEMCEI